MTAAGNATQLWQIAVTIHGNHHVTRLLRRPGGIAAWNNWVARLARANLLGAVWGSEDPPLIVALDMAGAVLPRHLDEIDLTFAWLQDADLAGCSLRGAKIGCCPGADFAGADLTGASFLGDISAADFDGCIVSEQTDFHQASYSDPPRGLALIDQCKADDWATPPAGRPGRMPWVRLRANVELLDLARLIPQEPIGNPPV